MTTIKAKCPQCQFVYDLYTTMKLPRSQQQNALYWVWMTLIGASLGYTKEEMHYVFKKMFLSEKMPVLSKDEFMNFLKSLDMREASTTKLSTGEMREYLDKIMAQARESGVHLPED